MKRSRLAWSLAHGVAWTALVLGVGCISKPGFDSRLQVHLSAEPVSLDPALAEDGVSLRVLGNLMDGLYGYDGGGKFKNLLALSHSVSQDGKRYEFTLRPEAKWSDGQPVRAQDFVQGLRRSLSPGTPSKLSGMLLAIRGAREFQLGKIQAEQLGVSAVDGKLVIELERPTPYFLQALTLPPAMPVRQDFLDQHQGKWTREAPVTGAYRLVQHRVDREMLLETNPHYWASRGSASVLIRVVADETTAARLFEQGKLDILGKIPALDFARFKRAGFVHVDPMLATYYLAFNTRRAPFNDREMRRAVLGAIRREEITRILGTGETPARSWVPEALEGGLRWSDPAQVKKLSFALQKKTALVAGFDSSGRNTLVMEKIQQDLRKNLGLEISLTHQDWKSYIKTLETDPPAIYRFAWLAPFADPITHLQVFQKGSANNYTGWSSAEYDRLVDEIGSMPSGPERITKIRRAQKILVDDEAVIVPLYHYVITHAVSQRVRGFRVSPMGVIRFDELSLQ